MQKNIQFSSALYFRSSSIGVHSSGASKGPQPLVLRENKTDVRITPEREQTGSASKSNASSAAAYPGANLVNSGHGGPITFQQQAVRAEVIDNVKTPHTDLMHHPNLRLLPVDRCGRNAAETTERIRGYQKASIGEYPWVAQLGELRGWSNLIRTVQIVAFFNIFNHWID